MMPERFMVAAARLSVRRPWVVLGAGFCVAALGLVLAFTRLEVKTSNLDLVSPALPEIGAFVAFAQEFGTPNTLIVALEGSDPSAVARTVDRLAPTLSDLPGVLAVISRDPAKSSFLYARDERYLTSDDGLMYFIFVQPDDPHSQAVTIEPFVRDVRATVDSLGLEAVGIRAGFTGLPQYALDDRNTIERDISRLSVLAFGLIFVLFALAFRSVLRPFMAMVALLIGVTSTLGVASIYPGHLTLLSAFFASILFGLGIDVGIHLLGHYEALIAQGERSASAAVSAVTIQAPALWTGALTTASAFFAMNLTDFSGFAELGTIAGVGVLLCLFSMVTVLPALLVLFGEKPQDHAGVRERPLDRLIGLTLGWAGKPAVVGVTCAAALISIFTPAPSFDSDYLNLQPLTSETVRLEREMVRRSSFSPVFAAFTVDSASEVEVLTSRLEGIEGVGAVRSIRDAMTAAMNNDEALPSELLSRFKSKSGRYAVYAYPSGNVWEAEAQDDFVRKMKGVSASVTGMPFVTQFMASLSKTAMRQCALASSILLLLLVYLSFRNVTTTVVVAVPVVLTVICTRALMSVLGISMNPLAIMAWPVALGISIDDSIHITHRFRAEAGDLAVALHGAGRSVVLTSLTTIAAFGTLAFTSHRGLASFGLTLGIGVSVALVLSVTVLPWLLRRFRTRILSR